MPGAYLDQVAAPDQPFKRRLELIAILAFDAEFPNELLERRPCVRQAGDVVEDLCGAHAFVW